MIAAPGMAIRAAGKTVAGFEKSNPAGIEGQSPVTVRPRRNQMTKATTTADTMSRAMVRRPRTRAMTKITTDHTIGMSAKTRQIPSSASGSEASSAVSSTE